MSDFLIVATLFVILAFISGFITGKIAHANEVRKSLQELQGYKDKIRWRIDRSPVIGSYSMVSFDKGKTWYNAHRNSADGFTLDQDIYPSPAVLAFLAQEEIHVSQNIPPLHPGHLTLLRKVGWDGPDMFKAEEKREVPEAQVSS